MSLNHPMDRATALHPLWHCLLFREGGESSVQRLSDPEEIFYNGKGCGNL